MKELEKERLEKIGIMFIELVGEIINYTSTSTSNVSEVKATELSEGWSYSQIKEFTGHKSDEMIRRYDKAKPRQKQLAVLKMMNNR